MVKIKGIINIEVTRKNVGGCVCNVDLGGSVGLCMYGLASALLDIENTLPEEERAQFRSDFLATVNNMRKESTNANT